MTKTEKWFLRIIAVILCVINVLSGTSSSSIISAAIEESVPVSDEEIAEALSNAQFIIENQDDLAVSQNSNSETNIISVTSNKDVYYNGDESDIMTATVDLPGDDKLYLTQRWLNKTYKTVTGYEIIEEDGENRGDTVKALIQALQHELGISPVTKNFGPATSAAYQKNILYPQEGVTDNKFVILQGALWCKGYSGGYENLTYDELNDDVIVKAVFDKAMENSIIQLKTDAGLENPDGVVTLNIMKALLSMDAFVLLEGTSFAPKPQIRTAQQKFNRKYERYIGIMPCDGIFSANTQRAIIKVLQALEGRTAELTTTFGEQTKAHCPEIPYKRNSNAARNYNGEYYSNADIANFTELIQFTLFVNGFGDGICDGVFDSQTQNAIRQFQRSQAIPETGIADINTWMSLFVSYGNKSRSALACDCATKLTAEKAKTLYDNGYRYVGRYLTKVPGGLDKDITREEAQIIFDTGLRFFPIYQTSGDDLTYFTEEQGTLDAYAAIEAASKLGVPRDTIIYFAADVDAMDSNVTNIIIPYFAKIHEVMKDSIYKAGIYSARNTCTRVSNEGYACSSFVSDLSYGYSGNLGFTMPDNWAFDQFATVSIGTGSGKISIDKDGFSGRDLGVSKLDVVNEKEISFAKEETYNDTLHGPVVTIMGKEVELFAFNIDFSLPKDKLVIETEFDYKENELNVIIGLDIYEYSQQRYGIREKPTGEKFTKAFVEVKEMVSTIKNAYSGIDNPEFKRRFKDIKGCLYDRGFELGISTNGYMVGYMTISFDGDKPFLKSGEMGIIASASANWRYPIAAIPTLTLRFAIEGSIEGGLGYILREDNIEKCDLGGHLALALKPSLSAGLNAYVASAYAGVGGELKFGFRFPFKSFNESFTANLSAPVFLEYTALNWHGREEFRFVDRQLYPKKEENQQVMSLSLNDLKLITPTNMITFANASDVFKSSIQVYAKPQIVNLSDNKNIYGLHRQCSQPYR